MKILETIKLKKYYGQEPNVTRALDGVDFSVEEGEFVAVVGTSGSGKSTLLHMMGGLDTPTSGTVIVRDKELSKMNDEQLTIFRRRNIGFIFQNYNLVPILNVYENIVLPVELDGDTVDQKFLDEIVHLLGLEDKLKNMPNNLSGGQQQRVAIARAMSTNPKVLLCDEATSALDPNTTKSILELLKKINRELGITVIVITHEMAVIESICDRVAIIDHSHIAESGKVSEIFSGPKSEIGRQLILGETVGQKTSFARARQIRVIFNGQESSEPIISNMVLACKVPVNILLADTHDIGGKAMGQMLLQLPEDEVDAGRICNYLKTVGVTYEEVR